ncbi:hypothetical protein APHAL10511_005235 [Amanita phalloides]|nr:hypothetical protein APHAL10511_005235 [Amanita phalloides]
MELGPSSPPSLRPSTPAQSTSSATDAQKPFDSSAKADIVLQSSDSVDFFVLKTLLSLASPILDDMVSSSQGDTAGENDTRNGLRIVQLPMDSVTLHNLLPLIYPFSEQPIADIDVYLKVANAAKTYGMNQVEERLRKQLETSSVMTREPVRVFAVAVYLGWKEEARSAALKSLATPVKDLAQYEELKLISGADYQDLLQWRFKCHRAVASFLLSDKAQSEQRVLDCALKRRFLANALLKQLEATDCPHSAVIMNDYTVVQAINNIEVYKYETPYQFVALQSSEWAQAEMLKVCRSMATQIDGIALNVPFDINVSVIAPRTGVRSGPESSRSIFTSVSEIASERWGAITAHCHSLSVSAPLNPLTKCQRKLLSQSVEPPLDTPGIEPGTPHKHASRKGEKYPKAPKRPLSAYMYFVQDWRERIKAENPDAGFGEVGKLLGAKWKELDNEEKKPYIERAAQDKTRADKENAAYEDLIRREEVLRLLKSEVKTMTKTKSNR